MKSNDNKRGQGPTRERPAPITLGYTTTTNTNIGRKATTVVPLSEKARTSASRQTTDAPAKETCRPHAQRSSRDSGEAATEKARALELEIRKVDRAAACSNIRKHPEVTYEVVAEDTTGGGDKGNKAEALRGVGWTMLPNLLRLPGPHGAARDGGVGDEAMQARDGVGEVDDRVALTGGPACGGGLGEARKLLRVASVMLTSMRALWAAIDGAVEAWRPPLHASA